MGNSLCPAILAVLITGKNGFSQTLLTSRVLNGNMVSVPPVSKGLEVGLEMHGEPFTVTWWLTGVCSWSGLCIPLSSYQLPHRLGAAEVVVCQCAVTSSSRTQAVGFTCGNSSHFQISAPQRLPLKSTSPVRSPSSVP